ncbi:MAG TPA: hypothetical protein ENK21_00455 [Trueperaceae bacterium]|nr:hypothetical protein [Trueperaceae bacterium]
MKSEKLNSEQKELLQEIDSAGVEVNYFLARKEADDRDEYSSHMKTALLTLEKVKNDIDTYFERLLLDEKYRNNKREDFYQIQIDPSKLYGTRIGLREFLGRYYCFERHKATIRGESSEFLNSYFWAGDTETTDNVVDLDKQFGDMDNGYAYAFFEPPYGIRGSAKEKEALFHRLERQFFGKFDVKAQIWNWSDECSNYFEEGNEWWGAYFYTYSLRDSDTILGVVASATD